MNNKQMISYCGFYCGACPKYLSGQCKGCRGDSPDCAVGYRKCKVRPCCVEHQYFTCTDCNEYMTVRDCRKYNPSSIRLGEFISSTSRQKAIEMIKEKGLNEFADYMKGKNWVTIKTKNTFVNKNLGKKLNEK